MSRQWRVQEIDPGEDPTELPSSTCGPVLLTGCGLGALWSPEAGITAILDPDGADARSVPRISLEGGARVVAADSPGGGTARRLLEGPGGLRVLEEVLLRDGMPGLLVRWSVPTGAPPGGPGAVPPPAVEVRVLPGGPDGGVALRIAPGRPVARLLHPGGTAPPPARGSFRAQARRRALRASLEPEPLAVAAGGPTAPDGLEGRIAAAVRALDDAALQEDSDGGARPPFLQGVEDGVLLLASGTPLVEIGLGALAAGRFTLAGAVLESLLRDAEVAPLPLVVLAAEWGGRTGDLGVLRQGRAVLEAAVARLASAWSGGAEAPPPHGRSFPGGAAALDALGAVLEPLGDREWTERVRAGAASVRAGAGTGRRALPVLGVSAPPAVEEPLLLPPVDGFAHPGDPGLLPRRTLHAARLLRAASEGLLGVRPDAPWGRVRLAPRLPEGWDRLRASGIRVGDTLLTLEVVVESDAVELELTPSAGRIPLNLVFEPDLPLASVGRVLLSGDVVEVDVLPGSAGRTGIRFQFPLDERKVVRVEPG